MGLGDINFTPEEMQEHEKAADLSFRSKQHEKASLQPKGSQLAALRLIMEHGRPEAVAAIAGISLEQLQSIVE